MDRALAARKRIVESDRELRQDFAATLADPGKAYDSVFGWEIHVRRYVFWLGCELGINAFPSFAGAMMLSDTYGTNPDIGNVLALCVLCSAAMIVLSMAINGL